MNRLTFLKSLGALAIAPAALLRVLAREPVPQVPRAKWISTDERWRRLKADYEKSQKRIANLHLESMKRDQNWTTIGDFSIAKVWGRHPEEPLWRLVEVSIPASEVEFFRHSPHNPADLASIKADLICSATQQLRDEGCVQVVCGNITVYDAKVPGGGE